MAISVGDIVKHGDFNILPVPQDGGFIARVSRQDGRAFTTANSGMPNHLHHHADTMLYPTAEEAVENGRLIADASKV